MTRDGRIWEADLKEDVVCFVQAGFTKQTAPFQVKRKMRFKFCFERTKKIISFVAGMKLCGRNRCGKDKMPSTVSSFVLNCFFSLIIFLLFHQCRLRVNPDNITNPMKSVDGKMFNRGLIKISRQINLLLCFTLRISKSNFTKSFPKQTLSKSEGV